MLNIDCKYRLFKDLFVSVQSPSTTEVEVPVAVCHNSNTSHCLYSHIGQLNSCIQLPCRLPVPRPRSKRQVPSIALWDIFSWTLGLFVQKIWQIHMIVLIHFKTRMHSSRMHTTHFSGRLGGVVAIPLSRPPPWLTPLQADTFTPTHCMLDCTPPAPLHAGIQPPCGQKEWHIPVKNITFPHLLKRAVIKMEIWRFFLNLGPHVLLSGILRIWITCYCVLSIMPSLITQLCVWKLNWLNTNFN